MGQKPIRRTAVFWFCCVVSWLDYIPRYGRLFSYTKRDLRLLHEARPPSPRSYRWSWQRYGLWGFHFMTRHQLFWPFLDEWEQRQGLREDDEDDT